MDRYNNYSVEIFEYQKKWPEIFKNEAEDISATLESIAHTVNHIGSTSVPELAAKPIIDILLQVKSIESLDKHISSLAKLEYHSMGEFGIPGRRYFWKGSNNLHTFHIHAFIFGNEHAKKHLFFRDFLRTNKELRGEYAQLKKELAQRYPHDIESYVNGKNTFVRAILEKMDSGSSLE